MKMENTQYNNGLSDGRSMKLSIKLGSALRSTYIILFTLTGLFGGFLTIDALFVVLGSRGGTIANYVQVIAFASSTICGLLFWGGLATFAARYIGTISFPGRK